MVKPPVSFTSAPWLGENEADGIASPVALLLVHHFNFVKVYPYRARQRFFSVDSFDKFS